MHHVTTPDPSGHGNWLLILGCPWIEAHDLVDRDRGVSGPSFATCAGCEHQQGNGFAQVEAEDWVSALFPERLSCGFQGGSPSMG